jgi:polyisoprenyl-phosphate glycosyltransferase
LGEYVTSIHAQVRKRPLVVERERINMADGASVVDAPRTQLDPENPVHALQQQLADAA